MCEQHLREPATPKDHTEALAYLRDPLAHDDRFWPEPDRADSLTLHGSYDIGALRLVLEQAGPGDGGRGTKARDAGR